MKQATLLFLLKDNQILLAMKKRGFGVDKWNGVGGKLDNNETVSQAAIRECKEEIGVTPLAIKERAVLDFYFADNKLDQQVIVYLCDDWQGEPCETEEMAPKWFKLDQIPYDKMWRDDELWLPQVIEGKHVKGSFYFDEKYEIVDYRLSS